MSADGNTILIVEDEKAIVDILEFNLKLAGYSVLKAFDGPEGLHIALDKKPELVLLDIMLPKMDGFAVCKAIRERDAVMPIVLLTARGEEEDKVHGLELGADDYITKPFAIKELLARVKANTRRTRLDAARDGNGEVLSAGVLTLRHDRMEVCRNGAALELSQREYDLLLYLWQRGGKIVSREELMEKVWGYDYYGDLRAVDVAVRRLREKVEENPAEPVYILTKRGAGYMFTVNG